MKVTCPKCQFENQADSSRVVCARCATIIEVRMDQGFDSNGKRQTARLPFASGDSSSGGQSFGGRFNQNDVYATRIGDDFDDVLDVPLQPQSSYQPVDDVPPAPVFEDLYTAVQSQDQTSPYDFPTYDKPPTTPVDSFRAGTSRQRDTQGYVEQAEQDFVGWPVLPEGSEEEEDEAGSGRGGLFLRIGLVVGLVGVLCFWAYYFLGDIIIERMAKGDQSSAQPVDASAEAGALSSPTPNPQVSPEAQQDNTPSSGGAESSGSASLQNDKPKSDQTDLNAPLSQPSPTVPRNARLREKGAISVSPVPKSDGSGDPNGFENPLKPPTPVPGGASTSRSKLTIQVGSFKDQGEADSIASSLNAATNGEFHVVKAEIPGLGIWYRVQRVSGFASREAAMSYGNQLRARNLIPDFIVTMR